MDNTGNVSARYTHGPGADEPSAQIRSGSTNYYQADGIGSVSALANSAGTIAATYSYDTFGNLSASTGSSANPLRYTARELDLETGLFYYRARYYDPTIGRFISEDALGFGGEDVNFYAYVRNNPVIYIDPFGYSNDTYVPDPGHHGGPHIDRYNPAGQNVGRYRPDRTPIPHKGKNPPPVPNADFDKFDEAARKLKPTKCQDTQAQPAPSPLDVPDGYRCADDGCTTIRPEWGGPSIPWTPLPVNPIIPPFEIGPLRIPIRIPIPAL